MIARIFVGFGIGCLLAVAALHFSAVAFGYESMPMYLVRSLFA